MTTPAQGPVGETFLARQFHAIGERPKRWFVIVWLTTFFLLLPMAFIGFTTSSEAVFSPPPESIPYSKFLPGGAVGGVTWPNVEAIPRENLPQYDASRWPAGSSRANTFRAGLDGEERLVVTFWPSAGSSGWPSTLFGWSSSIMWDVTDHTKPFKPWHGLHRSGYSLNSTQLRFFITHAQGAGVTTVWVDVPRLLFHLGIPLVAAVGLVWPLAAWYCIRKARRRRRYACVNCGHQRDPSRQSDLCTECGVLHANPYERRAVVRWRRRRLHATLLVIIVIATTWVLLQSANVLNETVYSPSAWKRSISIGFPDSWLRFSAPPTGSGQLMTARVLWRELLVHVSVLVYAAILISSFARWACTRRMSRQ